MPKRPPGAGADDPKAVAGAGVGGWPKRPVVAGAAPNPASTNKQCKTAILKDNTTTILQLTSWGRCSSKGTLIWGPKCGRRSRLTKETTGSWRRSAECCRKNQWKRVRSLSNKRIRKQILIHTCSRLRCSTKGTRARRSAKSSCSWSS